MGSLLQYQSKYSQLFFLRHSSQILITGLLSAVISNPGYTPLEKETSGVGSGCDMQPLLLRDTSTGQIQLLNHYQLTRSV